MDSKEVRSGLYLAYLDIKRLWSSNILRLSVLGLMVLPLLYSFIYLWAFWEPTSFLYRYPLAIVNLDQGKTEGNYTTNLGQDLSYKLVSDETMHWRSVSLEQAEQGLRRLEYFLVLVIPPDFTERAYSAGTSAPRPTILNYKINEGANMLGAKISRNIMEKVEQSLQEELTKRYLSVIFEQVQNGAVGLGQAAQGAKTLAQGANQAYQGSTALSEGLKKSGEGILRLESGLSQLQAGSAQLTEGTAKLNTAITAGTGLVEQYIEPLTNVLNTLERALTIFRELNQIFSDVIAKIRDNQAALTTAAERISELRQKTTALRQTALGGIDQALSSQQSSLTAARSAINSFRDSHPDIKDSAELSNALSLIDKALAAQQDIVTEKQQILAGIKAIDDIATSLEAAFAANREKIQSNLSDVLSLLGKTDLSQIINGIEAAKQKLTGLPDKLHQLVDATNQIAAGSAKLNQGLEQFSGGFNQLKSGNEQLIAGADKLTSGLNELSKGQGELAVKLSEAAGMAAQDNQTDARINVIADSVEAQEENLHPVPNNGTGFAPYFISLSLWVGSLVLFFIIDLKRVLAIPKRPISYMINKYLALASVSISQAVLSVFLLHAGLGLSSVLPYTLLYSFAIILGLAYTAILFMLIYILGEDKGRFAAVVILMLQLTSSSGSYPVQLEPTFFNVVHYLLPMTYAVEGLRNIISIGQYTTVLKDLLILTGYGVGALTILYLTKYRHFLDEITHSSQNT